MNDSSDVREDAIERAASVIEATKLRVLDRDWSSGEHRLDLVATPGEDILAAVEVRTVAHSADACVTALTEARFRKATDAARAWMREHGASYEDVWVVLVTLDPDGGVGLLTGTGARRPARSPRGRRDWAGHSRRRHG